MNDKRDVKCVRGTDETLDSYLGRVSELLDRIQWQFEGHRMWYTHKNPYGCWICDILFLGRQLYDEILVARPDRPNEGEGIDDDDEEQF